VVTLGWEIKAVKALLPPIVASRDAIFPALLAAVTAMVVVSLFTPKPKPEQLAQFAE
jgi:SSS family solute:Na+ symporter/sodium/proline symporter